MPGVLVAVLLAGAFGLLLWLPGRSTGPAGAAARPAQGFGRSDAPGQATLQSTGISDPALMLDLVAAMLDAGQSLLPALGVLADVVDSGTAVCLRRVQAALALGAPWAAAWDLAEPEPDPVPAAPDSSGSPSFRFPRRGPVPPKAPAAQLRAALTFVATTGAPSAAVLLAEAAQLRRRRAREAERRAAALGVRLVVPLGLCALPAFLALTVVPLLLSLLPAFP
ncbi:type II secretion system F family protein [Arthrobacter sp. zg-Y820]|uniref:type II secretion system F family protein n=1 Tax=unclassified Arthrobacter TaxID=235627 RepID=UPI001E4ABB67|nr:MULTISPECIES: type II secretion system F family protein [unclassified Arthrobacter]MCC9196967.1 type II secretion system F family protein [Arthrobacter sp. zg-Y820]MDK1279832.1 type II secretion system F family protein [Arthrobacter sp. zg.Y820]WIB09139.1 type II secretion system F family protein [Arthrobacter sp. zg-Y820]